MKKKFKTIDEQVSLLESRGVKTDARTAPALRREGYYAIVNGYKGPFLDREAMKSSAGDVYLPGTTFQQIFDLFVYDRCLRQSVLHHLMMAETALKNAVVYSFCERNKDTNAYLERSNYVSAQEMLVPRKFLGNKAEEHGRNMARLMRVLNGILSNPRQQRPFVRHYVNTYGDVPLWVLQNSLTFGNIAHFYQLQKRSVQNGVCKAIGEVSGSKRRLDPHDILRAFDVLVGFRNICAHGERLYDARVKGCSFSGMLANLSKVLPQSEISGLVETMNSLDTAFSGRMSESVSAFVSERMEVPALGSGTICH